MQESSLFTDPVANKNQRDPVWNFICLLDNLTNHLQNPLTSNFLEGHLVWDHVQPAVHARGTCADGEVFGGDIQYVPCVNRDLSSRIHLFTMPPHWHFFKSSKDVPHKHQTFETLVSNLKRRLRSIASIQNLVVDPCACAVKPNVASRARHVSSVRL